MTRALVFAAALAVVTVCRGPLLAQEPVTTRAEGAAREREAKAQALEPPTSNRLERVLIALENGRVFERLLSPSDGFYPKFGTVTPGSGFSLGPGYRKLGAVGDDVHFMAFAAGSLKRYWMLEARLSAPDLAAGRAFADLHAQRYDFPQEDFFGIGPESSRDDHVTYGFANTEVGGSGGVRPRPWLSIGGGLAVLDPRIDGGRGGRPIHIRFSPGETPGSLMQPNYLRYEAFADVNYREPRGNPRTGGRYAFRFSRFDDQGSNRYTFDRFDIDFQQYIPLVKDRRVLAFHALASTSSVDEGREIPFYLQRTLGGPDDLRGFRRYRFRDHHLILLQAEYRWEIFTAVDGAIFYDTGKVASRREDLDLNDLESNYGIGFRFGTINGVFLRIEGAFGSRDGKHFVFRFGHVF
jgi:hypothetical protein